MKISVIIPMYNSSETIIPVLESVRNQTFAKYIKEVIVIDDGSTDNSSNMVKQYIHLNREFVVKIINKENGGVSSARNEGMKASTGNWIALLDSDDIWVVDKLEKQVSIINKNRNIDFLGGDFDSIQLEIPFRKKPYIFKANLIDLCIKSFPSPSTAIFRKSIYESIGGFDETYRYAEDGNYFMKICNEYNYYHHKENMAFNIDSKPSFGHSGLSSNLKEMYIGNIRNIKELKDDNHISISLYCSLRIFHYLKYLRRIAITKVTI